MYLASGPTHFNTRGSVRPLASQIQHEAARFEGSIQTEQNVPISKSSLTRVRLLVRAAAINCCSYRELCDGADGEATRTGFSGVTIPVSSPEPLAVPLEFEPMAGLLLLIGVVAPVSTVNPFGGKPPAEPCGAASPGCSVAVSAAFELLQPIFTISFGCSMALLFVANILVLWSKQPSS